MIQCNSYYGAYRTRTFNEITSTYEQFKEKLSVLPEIPMNDKELKLSYYLIAARYGNSHIANSDENQYIMQLFSILLQYGPSWAKRYQIQNELRLLSNDEIVQGSKAIYNQAFNPDTAPSTAALEELPRIASQNTTNYKKSKMDAYAQLWDLIDIDVTEEYINKFKRLFIMVTAPDYPLLYETENEYGTVTTNS